jgi:hypothetical protein
MHDGQPSCASWARRIAVCALVALLSACSSMNPQSAMLGIRPATPELTLTDPCKDLKTTLQYAKDLQESYHARASMNRFSIYVAGILGLGTAAATGGLGAAGAAALTLALLSISGGFASGTFAVIENGELAKSYAISANEIEKGITSATADAISDPSHCGKPLTKLNCYLTKAKTELETARTMNAVGAAKRAENELTELKKVIAESENQNGNGDENDQNQAANQEPEENQTDEDGNESGSDDADRESKTKQVSADQKDEPPPHECEKAAQVSAAQRQRSPGIRGGALPRGHVDARDTRSVRPELDGS